MNNHSFFRKGIFGAAAFLIVFFSTEYAKAQRDPNLISSRHYIGIEAGVNESWFSGKTDNNFYFTYPYPFSDENHPVVQGVAFSKLGASTGLHIAGTFDYAISDFFGLQGKISYRTVSSTNTEQQSFIALGLIDSASGAKAADDSSATVENNYQLKLSYIGISVGARLQILPESWYGIVGIEYSSLISNELSGYQKIVSSSHGAQYLFLPSRKATTPPQNEVTFDQTSNNHFNSSQLALKLGTGAFFELGNSHWVLAPEVNVGIPLAGFFDKETEDAYKSEYPTNDSNNPTMPSVTAPKLWYASLSIALKFPLGALTREDLKD
jgi:hypothetical protein